MNKIPEKLDIGLEAWTYTENFNDRNLGAWASYPHWQDLAYDPNFMVSEMVPGDPNLSIVQKVTPYTNVDNYAGAQKLLDMYLVPGSSVSFNYYIKTNLQAEFLKVRFAAGEIGKIDFTLSEPELNKWVSASVSFDDFIRENPSIDNKSAIKIFALAVLIKIPVADPAMPFYFGLDKIKFEGAKAIEFKFIKPEVFKLPEFRHYIPKRHYHAGEELIINGIWSESIDRVTLRIVSYTEEDKSFYTGDLAVKDGIWSLNAHKLNYPEGLYAGKLKASMLENEISETEFTIHIAPNFKQKHPRLLFDEDGRQNLIHKFKKPEFKGFYEVIPKNAKIKREDIPVESLVFDLDQFPDENWLPTWTAAGNRIYPTGEALRWNAMAYAFHNDQEAGLYVKDILVKLAGWPDWMHPWQTKRKRFSDHRAGSWSHFVAEAYDLTYHIMTPEERVLIRKAILFNIIEASHQTYVVDDNVTAKTSNWIALVVGGSLMNIAAIFNDGEDTESIEPYFTGAMFKFYEFIKRVTDSKDGAWGEGLAYNSYSFFNMSYSIPSLNNVFNIDTSLPLVGTYNEYIWAGLLKERRWFEFGDSGGHLNPLTNWAFLLHMHKEPRLGWYYNYLRDGKAESNTKGSNTDVDKKDSIDNSQIGLLQDMLYNTYEAPQKDPFDDNPVKVFKEIGTTVFKSGWESDDFVFVMRTGPFYNHQHLDQGSFWLADRGVTFIEERGVTNSNYYDDPYYEPWLIQPVGHSTILINGNHQSQRTGDHHDFAPGFNDHAFISSFLDGKNAAFSCGDIGRLYWGKVKSLTRNVLFLKPRTVLMIDIAIPTDQDADISLLYQTEELESIHASKEISTISKKGVTLNLVHLHPENLSVKAVQTPHYLRTLQNVRPLKKEGMLTVNARTNGAPLVMANLLTTTASDVPDIKIESGHGCMYGLSGGQKFAFTTIPGKAYKVKGIETDAISMSWDDKCSFVAMAEVFSNSELSLRSDEPVTFEWERGRLKYFRKVAGQITINTAFKAHSVLLNGSLLGVTSQDERKDFIIDVPEGEGLIEINK